MSNRNDVKVLAEQIISFASDLATNALNGKEMLTNANELARASQTLVFTLGEVYALEQLGVTAPSTKKVVARVVGNRNYHNVRDSRGRFVSAVSSNV